MAEINDVTAKGLQAMQPNKGTKKSSSNAEAAPEPRQKDRVEIEGAATQKTEEPQPKVDQKDMDRYIKMLEDMPDVRDEEVARVEAILAEDGYGEAVLSEVAERIIEEEF